MKSFVLSLGLVAALVGFVRADEYTDLRATADYLKAIALDGLFYANQLEDDVLAAASACASAHSDASARGCPPSQLSPGTLDEIAAGDLKNGASSMVSDGTDSKLLGDGYYIAGGLFYSANDIPSALADMGDAVDCYTSAGGFYNTARQDRESAISMYEATKEWFESQNP
jgi:hypothetical protein